MTQALCQCGCGQLAPFHSRTGKPCRYVQSHSGCASTCPVPVPTQEQCECGGRVNAETLDRIYLEIQTVLDRVQQETR